MDLNKVQLIGRTTEDIILKETPNGKKVTHFSLATNNVWVDSEGQRREQSQFHYIVLWGKIAEIASEYLKKGKKVYIEGELNYASWEGEDKQKKYRTEILGNNIILLDGKEE